MTQEITRRSALAMLGGTAALSAIGMPAYANTGVTVGALRLTSHAPSFIALERGYFKESGLDVELAFFTAAQPLAVAIASGEVGYGATAISGGLISLAEKGAAKVIGGALIEEKGISGQKILASNDAHAAGLTSPKQLAGKRYGVTTAGSSFHYMGSKVAEAEGIGDDEVTFVPLQKVPAIIGALKTGQIDAWSIVPNIAAGLINSGAVKEIGEIADYIPGYQVTTTMSSATNAAGERDKTRAFLDAFARGSADFNAALVDKTSGEAEELAALIGKYVYPDDEPAKAAAKVSAGAMRIAKDNALNMASVEDQLNWFKKGGLVKQEVTMDMLVDASYVSAG